MVARLSGVPAREYAAKAAALFVGTSVAATADQALAELDGIPRIEFNDGAGQPRRDLPELISACPAVALPPLVPTTVTETSPAALYFTGGTTGKPKGALHSQASTVALHYTQMLEAEIAPEDRLLLMTPLAHAAGLFAQSAIIRGATCVLTAGFDPQRAAQLLNNAGITWTFLVPTMMYRILDVLPPDGDFTPAIRTIVYGGAPIAPRRLEEALTRFGPVFVQLYGQTESPNWGGPTTSRRALAHRDGLPWRYRNQPNNSLNVTKLTCTNRSGGAGQRNIYAQLSKLAGVSIPETLSG